MSRYFGFLLAGKTAKSEVFQQIYVESIAITIYDVFQMFFVFVEYFVL